MSDQYTVEHADNVEHSDQTTDATAVDHATHVDNVQKMEVVNGTPPLSPRSRTLKYVMNSLLSIVVLVSLVLTVLVVVDKNKLEGRFLSETQANRTRIEQLTKLTEEQTTAASDRLACGRKFQDVADSAQAVSQIDLNDLIVIVAQVPQGAERDSLINEGVRKLDLDNMALKKALNAKITYNNSGNPLPCPIGNTPPTP